MKNKPLTTEEIKALDKGVHLHKFPNRKQRREELQKPSSPTRNRLLVYEGTRKPFEIKERTQIIKSESVNGIRIKNRKKIVHFD